MKYTIKDLQGDFPDDDSCLEWLMEYRWPDGISCKVCQKITKHHRIKSRKSYSCGNCGNHVHPTAGTIYHNSHVPLSLWFYAVYIMANTRSGISAKQLEREIGVTYKTAWRMFHQIRRQMADDTEPLSGEVEVDETYLHPNVYKRSSAKRRYGRTGNRTGQILFGIVERGGRVKVWHVKSSGARVLLPLIDKNVKPGTLIHTDGYTAYSTLPKRGYKHRWTNHGAFEFYTPDSATQNIENVWSHLKRGVKGVYRHIEPKYVQNYANEYAWRYSHRHSFSMFWALMDSASKPVSKL